MKKFEYCTIQHPCGNITENATINFSNGKITKIGGKQIENVLNDLGKDGWEMVGCGTIYEGMEHIIYFKREII